jgi:exodeoxyribonuclease V alpha subunit
MSEQENLVRLLSGSEFPGIGRVTAERLVERFGERIYEVLDTGNQAELDDLLTEHKKEVLAKGWKLVSQRREVVRWFDQQGIEAELGDAAFKVWGSETIDKLEQNPYRLLFAVPWSKTDRIAASLGVEPDNAARLVGAVEAASYEFIDDGSTWHGHRNLREGTRQLLERRGSDRIDDDVADSAIEKAVETNALIRVGGGYQIVGAYYAEREVESSITRRVNDRPSTCRESVEEAVSGLGGNLTGEQRVAVRNSIESRVSVFYGGAGTGKTHVVKSICEVAEASGRHTILLALAAKAARKLSESTGREALTLARALHQRSTKDLDGVTCVIDEFSMVSLLEFRRLLRKLPENAHLVLCGDAAQLPSIGPGRLLHSLIATDAVPSQALTVTHRQAAETGIPKVLRSVRDGKMPELPPFDFEAPMREGIYRADCSGKSSAAVKTLVTRLVGIYDGQAQVVCPQARYPLGCNALNAHIHQRLMNAEDFVPGTPVVFTSNVDLADGIHVVNGLQGDVRRVIDQNPGLYDRHLEIGTDAGLVTTHLTETETHLDLAYALTVHRAQGSDWETIVAVLPPSRLLERSTIYTALSRCTTRAVVLAPDPDALAGAVAAPPSYETRGDSLFAEPPLESKAS